MINSVNSNQMNNQMMLRQPNGLQHQNFNAIHAPQNETINNKFDTAKKSPLASIGLFIASWFGLSKIADIVNAKSAGAYEQTLMGKIGNFGDRIGNTSGYKWIAKKMSTPINGIKNYWNKNNESNIILRWLKNPSNREWKFASCGQSVGYVDEVSMDVIDIMRGFKNTHGEEVFKKAFGNGYEFFDAMNSGAYKHADELEKALKGAIDYCKQNGISEKGVLRDIPMTSKRFQLPGFMSRNITLSEAYNKMQMVKGLKNPKQTTALGKLLPKWAYKTIEGLTNGTAGGKFVIAMQATMLADAIYRTYKAPKGEKLSTFMETMTNDVAMYMMIPLYTRYFNIVGGLKYLGMTTKQKEAYKAALGEFNTLAMNHQFASKDAYKAAKKTVTELRGAGSKWYLKPFRAIGRISDFGCERIAPFLKKGSTFTNGLKRFWHGLKGATGLGRMIFAMAVISPILVKPIVKVSHAIFGKPTDSVLDDGSQKEKATQQAANHQLDTAQLFAPVNQDGTNAIGLTQQEMQILKQNKLTDEQILQVAQYKHQQKAQNARMEELANATPLPSNNLLNKPMNAAKGVTQSSSGPRTYIPSVQSKIRAPKVGEHILKTFAQADLCAQDAESVLKG